MGDGEDSSLIQGIGTGGGALLVADTVPVDDGIARRQVLGQKGGSGQNQGSCVQSHVIHFGIVFARCDVMARLETTANVRIREHLGEILASKPFVSSPRLRKFLSFVVETTLDGDGGQIKEFLIATQVYQRGIEYDPQIDSTVRVEASRLRAKLREYYDVAGSGSDIRIDLPKGSYVPVFSGHEAKPILAVPHNVARTPRYVWYYGVFAAALAGLTLLRATFPTQVTASQRVQDPALVDQYLTADRLFRQPAFKDGWTGKVPPNVTEAISLFESITRRAPSFTKAWVGLGEAQEWAYELDKAHPRSRLYTARTALERAIETDPNHAEAHARLASVYFHGLGDRKQAEIFVKRAVALNPRDVRSQTRYASLLRIRGRGAEALVSINRALALEPSSSLLWAQQAILKQDAGRYDEAIAAADHALALDPGNQMNQELIALWVKGLSLYRTGRAAEAEAAHRKALDIEPEDRWNYPALGYLLAHSGREQEARSVLDRLIEQRQKGKPVSYSIALVFAGMGENDKAIEWLERGAASGESSMAFLGLDKRFENLRAHARFAALSRKVLG